LLREIVKKDIGFLPKILLHIVAITLFMFGCVLLHAVYNDRSEFSFMEFFGIAITKIIIFDTALLCVSMGFFIEFFLTFRPIHILMKRN